ncbi:hypothetical protein [Fervidicella metallireducens]|nr:hypothetical protein [Fervidicella metallireducens]
MTSIIYLLYKRLCMNYESDLNKIAYIAVIILLLGIIEATIAIYADLRWSYLQSLYQQNEYYNVKFLIVEYPFIKDYIINGEYSKQDFLQLLNNFKLISIVNVGLALTDSIIGVLLLNSQKQNY